MNKSKNPVNLPRKLKDKPEKIMQDNEKNAIKDKSVSSGVNISKKDVELGKKPIRVRKKTQDSRGDRFVGLQYKSRRVSKPESNYKQNSKLNTQISTPLPWEIKDSDQTKMEYTFGKQKENAKKLKQRRSASQTFLSREFSGVQGELMFSALRMTENGGREYDVTHQFHPYPGRFHPNLPKILLKQLPSGSAVFDPFMGGGTVLLEGLLGKHKVFGNDLNPIAKLVATERCRLISEKNASSVWGALEDVRERVKIRNMAKTRVHRKNLNWLSNFHPPYLFFELLHWIDGIENLYSEYERETLRAVFSSLIVKLSNKFSETSENTKQLSFPKGAVGKWMEYKTKELLKNQLKLAARIPNSTPAKIWNENISELEGPNNNSINCTITSPPFPGTYDYLKLHELRMKWLDFSENSMSSSEISNRNYSPRQWKQVFREFMLKLRRWSDEDGLCYMVLGDWLERNKRVSGLEFTEKYADSIGWKVTGSASVQREIYEKGLRKYFGKTGKWEHLILLRK